VKTTAQPKTTRQSRRFANKANRHALRQELQATKRIRYTLALEVA
jgi:hypothetical protein